MTNASQQPNNKTISIILLARRSIYIPTVKMQFITKLATLAMAAATVSANTVTFVNQDSTTRQVVFTPSSGHESISTVTVAGSASQVVTIPESWIGNWYAVADGSSSGAGMLGEVTFQGWQGLTYFDVSAIVNAADITGVKQIYPASQATLSIKTTVSGCEVFPCNSAYYSPDDIQTVTTTETDLICTLGTSSSTSKRDEVALVARKFVLGKF